MNDDIKELMKEYSLNVDDHEYLGVYDRAGDYAKDLLDECGDIPKTYRDYIDYKAYERDMVLNGVIIVIEMPNEQVYVFRER